MGVERSEQRLGLIRKILDGSIWWMISQISTLLLRHGIICILEVGSTVLDKFSALFCVSEMPCICCLRCPAKKRPRGTINYSSASGSP